MHALVVAQDIPGRLRVRVPLGARTGGLEETVRAVPGVTRCTWTPRTRSLLVLYEPGAEHAGGVLAAVTHATGLAEPAPETAPAVPPEPGTAVAQAAREMFGEIDKRVVRATKGLVGLGGLFPVALAAWAVAEVARGRVAPLAWSSALWYAHGLFRDYQVPTAKG
jgi:hypothetical protein